MKDFECILGDSEILAEQLLWSLSPVCAVAPPIRDCDYYLGANKSANLSLAGHFWQIEGKQMRPCQSPVKVFN